MAAHDADTDGADFLTFRERRDHDTPDVAAYADLAADLRGAVEGEVRFDEYAQVLYASDGSIYQARPAGVVIPRYADDVRAAVRTARDHGVPVLPRGAGSSLAGQAVGPGCVVVDCSKYMDDVVDIDPEARRATVQPGVVQDDLDEALAPHGLKFAPDPASSNRATVGGGIGNNSTGAHSVRYGITDAYVEELEVVLADGSLVHTREVVLDSEEWDAIAAGDGREAEIYRTVRAVVEDNADEIESRYPDLKRNVSGYNLDRVVYENEAGERCINLSTLLVGSEGTLGVVVEATVSLVTTPEETALSVYCYDDLLEALAAVPTALDVDASAVELMDAEVFRLAADSDGYAGYVDVIPDGTEAALMVEFDSELHDDLEAAVAAANERLFAGGAADGGTGAADAEGVGGTNAEDTGGADAQGTGVTDAADAGAGGAEAAGTGTAFEVIEALDEESQSDLWTLRKAAIPLLMSLEGDPKPYPFIEDATVPPEELAEYVSRFMDVLEAHDTTAAYFAHAGAGTLHIRPILDLKDGDDVETMHSITDAVTDLVLEHHGSFSGEHGDGRARTEFNPKMYGPDLWRAFKTVKTAFDPDWDMHPGNVVYRDGPDDVGPDSDRGVGADMREDLRYGPTYQSVEPQTALDFDDEGGFSHLVELCNGCGTCRMTGTGTMCPTYRASRDEIESTRGRANMLRAAISGELPPDEIHTREFQEEVLDLCIGCKGCKNDCPTGVDLAKLKAEVKHRHHEETGVGLRERLFGNIDAVSRLGSALAPLSNWAPAVPGSRWLLERTVGIAADRQLPTFERATLADWFAARGGARVPESDARDRVLLVPDAYTNYSYPGPGKAAVRVLEAAGIHVQIPESVGPVGRAAYSKGLLDVATDRARHNVEILAPLVEEGWSVVSVEPSDAVMFQDEYADLLDGEDVLAVGANAYGVCEYLDTFGHATAIETEAVDGALTYHGHCNQKATNKAHHAAAVLADVGYEVDVLDSGCCGMAGSFGYEAEHYDLSMAIGRILFEQVEAGDGETVVAPGASCRTQLGDHYGEQPPHPVEKVAEALSG